MSKGKPLRVGLVAEGPTDFSVLKAVIDSLLIGRPLIFAALQPLLDETFQSQPGSTGLGWPGVYRWCSQTISDNEGKLGDHPLFAIYDVIVVQVDADVASTTYKKGHIEDPTGDLPCAEPCPPCTATTNRLREVMLRWMGEREKPLKVVLCTPAQALESWMLAALFPKDALVQSGALECIRNPKGKLKNRPQAQRVTTTRDYEAKAPQVGREWKAVRAICSEAQRFHEDFMSAVP